MFTTLKKRLAIRSYVRKLGPALRRRYGRQHHYTPEQVRRTASLTSVNTDYLCYAYCIYCSREAFELHHRQTGEPCNYDAMRTEVGAGHFRGDTSFDANDAIDATTNHHSGNSWWGTDGSSDSGSWSDSSGGGSGGGDGSSGGD